MGLVRFVRTPAVETAGYFRSSLQNCGKFHAPDLFRLLTSDFCPAWSLPFVFALAEFFIDLKAGFLRVREGDRFGFLRGTEIGNDFAHRLFARRTIRQRLGRERTVQGEFPAADLAVAFAQFIFVNRHGLILNFNF